MTIFINIKNLPDVSIMLKDIKAFIHTRMEA